MRSLLDVNVILALLDSDHVSHDAAHQWWNTAKAVGWASCPLTENAVVRIMSQPSYSQPDQYSPRDVLNWLTEFATDTNHEFWSDDLSLTDTVQFAHHHILGHRQITDIYLLALAVKRNGALVTFDRSISTDAVRNAKPSHLVTI